MPSLQQEGDVISRMQAMKHSLEEEMDLLLSPPKARLELCALQNDQPKLGLQPVAVEEKDVDQPLWAMSLSPGTNQNSFVNQSMHYFIKRANTHLALEIQDHFMREMDIC